ncbi:MAG TPA: hypothetical protein PKC45_05145 [Gemmatales bacterium]|nr:hypothetical protein [Gemmatales bacterium]
MSHGSGRCLGLLLVLLVIWPLGRSMATAGEGQAQAAAGPRFVVSLDPDLAGPEPLTGRLVLVLGRAGEAQPRRRIGQTGMTAAPIFGVDADAWTPARTLIVDQQAAAFPVPSLAAVPAGEYSVQAVLMTNRDLMLVGAPGNLVSKPLRIRFDPQKADSFELKLTERLPDERLPTDTDRVRFLKFPSPKLSEFHGRPMFLRAAVILPADFDAQPEKRYPLCVHIGGFSTRFTAAPFMVRVAPRGPGSQFLHLFLDGAGPFGDPYQVNSANNGPFGDALVEELIPHVEKNWRGIGAGHARFTTGGSTGGWVSLALQVFYPDFFNGCWSQCPDAVDFRSFELINIYEDQNAYVNRWGFERPAKRTVEGDTIYTVRHEAQVENVLGRGDNWALGGRDWCSWNATYGPRGPDGLPTPLWHPQTGVIDRAVLDHWRKYDLRLVVEQNWKTLGPKLNGKINIWVGDADDYFLNNGVHHFKKMTERLKDPPFEGTVLIEMRQPHTSGGWTESQMYEAMLRRVAAGSQR